MNEITAGIWEANDDLYMPGRIHFPLRMLVIQLSGGELLLHSPIALNDELEQEIRSLGEVKYVIAPNLFHHLFVEKALQRFPKAKLYGAPGFAKKRPELPFAGFLDEETSYPWSEDLVQIQIEGAPELNEFVFFHRASSSLVVTDLVFNITQSHNFQTDLVYRMAGTYRKLAQSRLWRVWTKDKKAMKASIGRVLAWDARRLIMAHGKVYEGDVRDALRGAIKWLGDLTPDHS